MGYQSASAAADRIRAPPAVIAISPGDATAPDGPGRPGPHPAHSLWTAPDQSDDASHRGNRFGPAKPSPHQHGSPLPSPGPEGQTSRCDASPLDQVAVRAGDAQDRVTAVAVNRDPSAAQRQGADDRWPMQDDRHTTRALHHAVGLSDRPSLARSPAVDHPARRTAGVAPQTPRWASSLSFIRAHRLLARHGTDHGLGPGAVRPGPRPRGNADAMGASRPEAPASRFSRRGVSWSTRSTKPLRTG